MTRTPTRRRDTKRPLQHALTGLAVVAVLVACTVFALRSASGVPGVPQRTMTALIPDAGTLRSHNLVMVAGVREGEVLEVAPSKGGTRVRFKLDGDTERLPVDTRAAVRGQGLLGTRYLELIPGSSPRTLDDGATIRAARDGLSYGASDALETFDRETRGAFRGMAEGLSGGLLGRGRQLNGAIARLPRVMREYNRFAAPLLADRPALRRLVPSLAQGMAALDAGGEDLARALAPTAQALTPFVEHEDSLHATLEQAPAALDATRAGVDAGRQLLAGARALSHAASDALPAAPAGLRETTALLREADRPLDHTRALLAGTRPAVPAALRVTSSLEPVLDPTRRALVDLRAPTETLGAHGCDVINFADNWRSFVGHAVPSSSRTGVGPLTAARIGVVVGVDSVLGSTVGSSRSHPALTEREHIYPKPCAFGPNTYDSTGLEGLGHDRKSTGP